MWKASKKYFFSLRKKYSHSVQKTTCVVKKKCPEGTFVYNFQKGPLEDDKVSVLTHTCTYLHKPLRKIKVTICNHQADSPLYVWPDV